MKKILLLFTCIFFTLTVEGQIKVTFKSNRTVKAQYIEFTKKNILIDDYDKTNSPIYEMLKSNIEEVVFEDSTSLKGKELEEKISSDTNIERLKGRYNDKKPTKDGHSETNPFESEYDDTRHKSKDEMLKEIDGQWEVDENNNVSHVKVYELPNMKKEELYIRALNFFTYNYNSGKSVIQIQDKETGTIVGKGIFPDVHVGVSILTTVFDAWHILRIDVKDGKARAILTLTEYETKETGTLSTTQVKIKNEKISQCYPIASKGVQNIIYGKAFYKSHQKAMKVLNMIEKSLKEGNTSKSIENRKW